MQSPVRRAGRLDGLSQASNYLGDIARIERDYASAESFYGETVRLVRVQGFKSDIPAALHNLGYIVLAQGDHRKAEALFKESLTLQQEIGNKQGISECLTGFAALAAAEGDTSGQRACSGLPKRSGRPWYIHVAGRAS